MKLYEKLARDDLGPTQFATRIEAVKYFFQHILQPLDARVRPRTRRGGGGAGAHQGVVEYVKRDVPQLQCELQIALARDRHGPAFHIVQRLLALL